MQLKTVFLLSVLNAFIISTGAAASVEQVGTYEGTIQIKITNIDGSKSRQKASLKIEIAADDVTTVTVDGTVKQVAIGGYGPTGGILIFGDNSPPPIDGNVAALQISNGVLKGTALGYRLFEVAGPPTDYVLSATTQSKLKAKKVP